jgi:hypothetical protein
MSITVFIAIFLWLLAIFPFGEKLIAPEMQCIVHAVVFNRTAAIDDHERPLFEKLLWGLVSSTIFVRC